MELILAQAGITAQTWRKVLSPPTRRYVSSIDTSTPNNPPEPPPAFARELFRRATARHRAIARREICAASGGGRTPELP